MWQRYLTFKLPCPEPIAFTASLRLYCFMRRCRGFLSDAGTPYRKVFPISFLCRTSSEQSPFEVPATKEGENFLHGFDTQLRCLTLTSFDYRPIGTLFDNRLISLRLPKATLLSSGPTSQIPHHPGYCKVASRSDLHCNAFKRATGTPFASLGVMSGRLSA